jgi:tRNA (guanine10-N2)-dimethyltransferase
MPFRRPIVMEPHLARSMVNLTGLPPGSIILDPFMGPGGLSIEAGHLDYRVMGVERDPDIFRGALSNIEAQGLTQSITAHLGDSRNLSDYEWWGQLDHIDGIVTDPPFGRSAPLMGEDPTVLLKDVLGSAGRKMKTGSPLVLDTDRESNLSGLDGFELHRTFPFRVHKSLTRFIGVLKKK